MKVKGLIKTAAVVLFSFFLLCSRVSGEDTQEVFGAGLSELGTRVTTALSRTKDGVIFGFLLRSSTKQFLMLCDFVEAYIAGTKELVFMEFEKNSGGRKGFMPKGTGVLRSYTTVEEGRIEQLLSQGIGEIYIDGEGAIHLLLHEEGAGALDFTLDLSGFRDYADGLELLPSAGVSAKRQKAVWALARHQTVTAFLYDTGTSMSSRLFGELEGYKTIPIPKMASERLVARLGIRSYMLAKPVDLENAGLLLAAEYPYTIGRETVYTFGLIAIVILTILLLWLIVYYTTSYLCFRGMPAMGDQNKQSDVISEIDQELSGTEEKEKPEVSESPTAAKGKEETKKQLEEDGIFIEK